MDYSRYFAPGPSILLDTAATPPGGESLEREPLIAESVSGASYTAAGVDIEAGDRAVELFAPIAKKVTRLKVRGGLGGSAGLFALDNYERPLLTASSDGVGTKLAVTQAVGKHDTISLNLVAIVVDNLVVCGAEPLFLQDYIAVGRVVPEHVAGIVSGIAEGCVQAGCTLLSGETAEHPGVMKSDEYDVSTIGVDVVGEDKFLGPDHVREGNVTIAIESSGLHSNSYSLVRYVLLEKTGLEFNGHVKGFRRTLSEELLEPAKIYAKDCLALMNEAEVRTFCHVTGGGLAGNMVHIMPEGLTADMSRATWTPGPIFKAIAELGNVSHEEMKKAFSMGVGVVAIVSTEDRDRALVLPTTRHINA